MKLQNTSLTLEIQETLRDEFGDPILTVIGHFIESNGIYLSLN